MFQPGDKVYVEKSGHVDVGFKALSFITDHPFATVKALAHEGSSTPEHRVYALEWDTEFSGGIDCYGVCAPRRGQFVTGKHLSLCFEASREVVTMPRIS